MITLAMLYSESILAQMGISFVWRDRVFPSYLIFWVLGLYVGKDYDRVRETLKKHVFSVLAMGIPILLYGVGMLTQHTKGVWLFDGNVIKMFSDCMTICVVLTACIFLCDRAETSAVLRVLTKPLAFIYAASFTVYLSHCLFLQNINSVIYARGITDIGTQTLLRALMCYTAPFLLWYLWHLLQKGTRWLYKICLRKKA